jgi:hypothetical protein
MRFPGIRNQNSPAYDYAGNRLSRDIAGALYATDNGKSRTMGNHGQWEITDNGKPRSVRFTQHKS